MPIIEMPMYKQVNALLKKKRKERLYNIQDTILVDIKDMDISDFDTTGFKVYGHNRNPDFTNTTHFLHNDGELYTPEYTLHCLHMNNNIPYEQSPESVSVLVHNVFSGLGMDQSEIVKNHVINKIDDVASSVWLQNLNRDTSCQDAYEDDIKTLISDNGVYAREKMLKECERWVSINGLIYRKVETPRLSLKLDSTTNFAFFPIYLADVFPSDNNMFQYYDMSKIDKKEEYGKRLFDMAFGTGLYNNMKYVRQSSLKKSDLDEKYFIDVMCDRLGSHGAELKTLIQKCRDNNYELMDVLDVCSLVHDLRKENLLAKNNTAICLPGNNVTVNIFSDHVLMEIASLVGSKRGDIERSYFTPPEDKPNVFFKDGTVSVEKINEFSHVFPEKRL